MNKLKLVTPSMAYESEILAYREDFKDNTNGIEGSADLSFMKNVEEWLSHLQQYSSWETVPVGRVPGLEFLAVHLEDKKIVGMLNLRLALNDYLLNFGGHIGYAICPSERQKGYGEEMLRLALPKAKEQGLSRVLITCAETNLPSAFVIEKNGGVLEDKRFDESDWKLTRRYWFNL